MIIFQLYFSCIYKVFVTLLRYVKVLLIPHCLNCNIIKLIVFSVTLCVHSEYFYSRYMVHLTRVFRLYSVQKIVLYNLVNWNSSTFFFARRSELQIIELALGKRQFTRIQGWLDQSCRYINLNLPEWNAILLSVHRGNIDRSETLQTHAYTGKKLMYFC